ncbi:interleukin-17 receptor A [Pygocentrus nattereri]|uniref:SEFIR domain-containing protein n=1 Tax=Pygocentrus nattereri TaxID=42514 RepID=A0A3B4E9C2_PYGNA|nr:interleukin-17 receptor A [Pygocentrus nattereri]
MIFVFLLLSVMTEHVSPLGLIKDPPVQCSQEGLSCSFNISKSQCSHEGWVKLRQDCPMLPEVQADVSFKADESEDMVPILLLTITEPADGSIFSLQGTEVHVREVTTNSSLCIRYMFPKKITSILTPDMKPWSFTLDRVVVNPGLTYNVSVSNLPKPDVGSQAVVQNIVVPGCTEDPSIQKLTVCLENGSLWDPNPTWSFSDTENDGGVITVTFNTGKFSELYIVGLHHPDFDTNFSLPVSKDNCTSVNVTFWLNALQLKHSVFVLVIKPFFVRCMNSCSEYQKKLRIPEKVQICSCPEINITNRQYFSWAVFGLAGLVICAFYAALLHSNSKEDSYSSSYNTSDKEEVESVPVQRPSKVFIIYSLDHPLYKEIVLKLCAFLRAKCGTEVTLDLLDFTWLSTVGSIQWLDMQREKLSRSSDKVLILCSPGVYAKWKGMCGGRRVMTREDVRSPMGDMLSPALSLIVPDFVHASSFHKYIVAYLDDVCNEKDVPGLFNVAVKYQLMKHFEELFFRLIDKEKHEPGRIKQVDGISGDDYFNSSPGRALKDAIEAFQAYQMANPNWFEMELVDADREVEENDLEWDCTCVLQNQLWATEITTPALVNSIGDQMHEAKPVTPNAESTVLDVSLNGIYPTATLMSTLSSHISHLGNPNKAAEAVVASL